MYLYSIYSDKLAKPSHKSAHILLYINLILLQVAFKKKIYIWKLNSFEYIITNI